MNCEALDDGAKLRLSMVKLAMAAEELGLSPDDLICLLDSGLSLQQLVDYIMAYQFGCAVEN
jgi:hypothetical protein